MFSLTNVLPEAAIAVTAAALTYWYMLRKPNTKCTKTGVEFMRRCTQDERELLTRVSGTHNTKLPAGARIQWHNVFVDGKYTIELGQDQSAFDVLVWRLAKEAYPHFKPLKVLSVSFLTSPANGKYTQRWHYDYYGTEAHIIVNMSPLTPDNSTQTIELGMEATKDLHNLLTDTAVDLNQIFDKQGQDFVLTTQLACREFSVLKINRGTIHRGIANRGSDDRRILCILVDERCYPLHEKAYNTTSSDEATTNDADDRGLSLENSNEFGTSTWDSDIILTSH